MKIHPDGPTGMAAPRFVQLPGETARGRTAGMSLLAINYLPMVSLYEFPFSFFPFCLFRP